MSVVQVISQLFFPGKAVTFSTEKRGYRSMRSRYCLMSGAPELSPGPPYRQIAHPSAPLARTVSICSLKFAGSTVAGNALVRKATKGTTPSGPPTPY